MRKGIDYAWAHPYPEALRKAGYSFACRYLSHDPGKNLSAEEASSLRDVGIDIVVVWESTANRALKGATAGAADAKEAREQATACGLPVSTPIYFAVDFDAQQNQQAALDAYFKAAGDVLGKSRVGVYGGLYVVQRLFDSGLVSYGWQTYAWSYGQWDKRAQLRQVENGITVDGVGCDRDVAVAEDFGQWSVKQTPKPVPKPSGPGKVAPAVLRKKTGRWAWLAWTLGEADWKGYGRRNPTVRPNVPKKTPKSWWPWASAFLNRRKK